MADCDDLEHYLGTGLCSLTQYPEFEMGIVNYIENLPLSDLQSKSMEISAKEAINSARVDGDYAESLIAPKKAKRDHDLLWIPSTSNKAERLFSRVKWILSDQKKRCL